jgi:hypothetical protein
VIEAAAVALVVDVANVMGSRPDGWWRDRAGAASRLVTSLVPLVGRALPLGQDGAAVRVVRVLAVVEGQARGIAAPDAGSNSAGPATGKGGAARAGGASGADVAAGEDGAAGPSAPRGGLELVRAERDGDTAIVETAQLVLDAGEIPLVVTADRGLRARLPASSVVAGPRRLLALL